MKKIIPILTVFMFGELMMAQIKQPTGYELGIRTGSWGGSGASVDGVMKLGENRLHADLGLFENAFTFEGFYDWSFPIAEDFSFYPGVGFGLGLTDEGPVLGLGGELGLEYAFKIPLSIGIDWRPLMLFINDGGFGYSNGGLNIRYRF